MTDLKVEVRGLEELQHKLGAMPITNALRQTMLKASIYVEGLVAHFSPTDTGRFRSSIGHRVEGIGSDIVGTIGSNVQSLGAQQVYYTPYIEYPTRPHWPPLTALETWARRHGMTAFMVARAIARFGTRGRFMFRKAWETGKSKVQKFFDDAIADLVRKL